MVRQHRPITGRVHTLPILKVLSRAEGGRLHYGVLDAKLVNETGKRVSSLNIILDDLCQDGFVTKLPGKEGYEITEKGRSLIPVLEPFMGKQGSSGNGGEGVGR